MIADREGLGAEASSAEPADRCPCPRPFTADFDGCAAYQPVSFISIDSLSRPLRPSVTCRHLTVGNAERAGRFYPRCGLGGERERTRWLASAGPERVAIVAALQEEFDATTLALRERLFAARAEVLGGPATTAPAERLRALLEEFLATARGFVAAQGDRLADVGLPGPELLGLIEDWARAWASSRDGSLEQIGRAGGRSAPAAPAPPLPGPSTPAVAAERQLLGRPLRLRDTRGSAPAALPPAADDETVLIEEHGLRLVQRHSDGLLRLEGEADASGAQALAAALSRATAGGPGDRHLDLSGLLFCDVAGLRALAAAAQRPAPHGRLVVHGMPPHLRRALDIAGWAGLPGLVVPAEAGVRA